MQNKYKNVIQSKTLITTNFCENESKIGKKQNNVEFYESNDIILFLSFWRCEQK